jgi:hypothetical protein
MKPKQQLSDEEIRYQFERERLEMSRPRQRDFRAFNAVVVFVLFIVLCVAVVLNRRRLGALWQQITGKAPPLWVQPEPPERDGPMIEGRDF